MLTFRNKTKSQVRFATTWAITTNEGRKARLGAQSSLLNVIKNHLGYYPTPNNLYYVWGLGSLLGIMLVIQVLTGVLLAMHYAANIELAFEILILVVN